VSRRRTQHHHDVLLPDDELRHRCEQAIRNHDPCISCATHFLKLDVEPGSIGDSISSTPRAAGARCRR